MSTCNRSLSLEESPESIAEFEEYLEVSQLSIGKSATEKQPKTVKISGTMTVSF